MANKIKNSMMVIFAVSTLVTATIHAADADSTAESWAEPAAQYRAHIANKSIVNSDIQKTADGLTAGVTAKREQARQLYNFVVQQILPVTFSAGYGRSEPQDASSVLRNRYGDGIDRSVLFEALLKAKGIDSTVALINSGNSYVLPAVGAQSASFNRVITYLPGLDTFADVGTTYAAFGELPFSMADKPTLLIANGQIKRTPLQNSNVASNSFESMVNLDEEGNAAVKSVSRTTGHEAIDFRKTFATRDISEIASAQFTRLKLGGEIAYDNDDTKKLGDEFTSRWQATFTRLIDFDKRSFAVPQLPGETDLLTYAALLRNKKDSKANWICEGNRKQVHIQLQFPQGVKIAAIPQNVSISTADITYTATYVLQDGILSVDRIVTRMQPSHLCTPEQAKQWQIIADVIEKDLRTPILLQ